MKRDVNLNTAFRAVTEDRGRGREFPLAAFKEKEKKNRSKELISYSIPLLLIAYTLQLGIVFLAYKLTQAKVN